MVWEGGAAELPLIVRGARRIGSNLGAMGGRADASRTIMGAPAKPLPDLPALRHPLKF
jgi:hypothetical protein